jgi:hypothetical protein
MKDGKQPSAWFSIVSVLPWIVIASVYLEAGAARLVLSRWPRPMLDDPKQLPTAPLHAVLQILVVSLTLAVPLMIGSAAWNWRRVFSDSRYSVRILVFGGGLLALWLLATHDPGRVWHWFLD